MPENQFLTEKVSSLVEKYDSIIRNRETAKYVEAMTKTVLIQPLFEALGWKFDGNEVTLEENVGKDFADYGFRINGVPKFFLEAKSLKVDLDHPKFIKQAIDYAWYKGCPWAVLTNFERIRIFNAEWKGKSLMDSHFMTCLLYTSPSPRDRTRSRMPSSA
mgnify:CR=1 FL=1